MGLPVRGGDYRSARIGAALALTGVVILLLLGDAVNPAYTVDHIVLASLLAAIGTLLGIEAVNLLRRPSPPPPTWTDTGPQHFDVLRDDPDEDVTP